ncbi:hypothetical protein KDA_41210 [Dictyobacter alpinus]|uniref:Uncharacterized protein n=1 Tax=Dictyobacter alpinus TaxID=2014873 RepID=A0A402BBI7_9CHLR|nr:hypothetical protein KDA_41210 [Dictyobacter alpinus]
MTGDTPAPPPAGMLRSLYPRLPTYGGKEERLTGTPPHPQQGHCAPCTLAL